MQTHGLSAHPAHPPLAVRSVEARIGLADHGWLQLRWRVEGGGALHLPPFAGRGRADGLWRTTCFELFCRTSGQGGYTELNLSPSEQWAIYDFARYREGMADRPVSRAPILTMRRGRDVQLFDAAIRLSELPPLPWDIGLSAVLEERGERSFWAIRHPPRRPDFHDPACFAARLAPPPAE